MHHHTLFHQPAVRTKRLSAVFLVLTLLMSLVALPVSAAPSSAPVVYRGDQWFGGAGVNVCTNTNSGGSKEYCGTEPRVGGAPGAWWQCVEFVQRFYKKMGWHSGVFSGVWTAHDIYDVAAQNGFTRQANGSITNIEPGDMIVHHKNAPYTGGAGHVSIVDRVVGSIVYAVEQNTGSPTAAYTLSGKTLNRQGLTMIRGIVKPKNNSSNTSSGEATGVAYATEKDGSPRVFSSAKNGKVYQIAWNWGNDSQPALMQIGGINTAVTAITAQSTPNNHPQVLYGTQSGDIYRVQWSAAGRATTRIASVGSPVLSLAYAPGTNGRSFVYAGTQGGSIYAAQWTGSGTAITTRVADVGSAVNSLVFGPDGTSPRLYSGTQSGSLHETSWAWNTLSYTTSRIATLPSAINSMTRGTTSQLYVGTQDGSIFQTTLGSPASSQLLTKQPSAIKTVTYGETASGQPRLYSSASSGTISQTRWGDTPLETTPFDAVNGVINQIIYTRTNTGQPRLYSASNNGGIYQTHWGDAKLGVLQLARP